MTTDDLAFREFLGNLPLPIRRVHSENLDLTEPFLDLVGRFADEPGTIALVSGGTQDTARYHILGIRPWLALEERDGVVVASFPCGQARLVADAFPILQALMDRYALPPDGIRPLSAGLLGYFSYDLKDCIESLPTRARDDLGLPRLHLVAPSLLVVHDRQSGDTMVHAPVFGDDVEGRDRLERFRRELSTPNPPRSVGHASAASPVSGFTRERYLESVCAVRDYIARGHVYQVNLAQRFETRFDGDAFALFARLHEANPAPFFAFVKAGDHQIVSSSPERLVELRGRDVETRPIKGTRPRGSTPEQDLSLRQELASSAKDDAELSMIVDLLRNDLGKVCVPGSVRVHEHKRLESYGNVHHLVSVVRGELEPDATSVDLVRALFPGGSITGCPKIRAMEIIDELEPVRRHVYTGSIGYLAFSGDLDLSIAIRTATITAGRLVYSVGGGIVHDSDPAQEYEETLHKGRSIREALISGPRPPTIFPLPGSALHRSEEM